MASHLLWFRLPKGRVWHVACSGAQVALCGQSIPARGERQPKRPPFGARPCPDCGTVSLEVSKSWTAAADRCTGALSVRPIEPEDLPDVDLPGMWSRSDFMGGDPDERSYAQREADANASDEVPKPEVSA